MKQTHVHLYSVPGRRLSSGHGKDDCHKTADPNKTIDAALDRLIIVFPFMWLAKKSVVKFSGFSARILEVVKKYHAPDSYTANLLRFQFNCIYRIFTPQKMIFWNDCFVGNFISLTRNEDCWIWSNWRLRVEILVKAHQFAYFAFLAVWSACDHLRHGWTFYCPSIVTIF